MNKLPVAKESLPYLITTSLISVLFYLVFKPLFFISLIILIFILFFFRNPYRTVPTDTNIIVSPADGIIMSIEKVYESSFIKSEAIKISIFLSLFNVHFNRVPVSGIIKYTHYRPGKYLPAFKSHASEINERNTIGIECKDIKVLVHQITGFVARRIVCWVKFGQQVNIGDRFGLIKFGSCTEIIVPANVNILVKPGDKVKGAKTIIGVIK